MKEKIVFFGSSKHVLPIIKVLKDKFDLALVATTEQESSDAVPYFCKINNLPFLSVERFDNEVIKKIKNANSDIAVLGYFGFIVPKQILDIFPKGIVNLHPSLLPKYRGPTPVQESILNDDKKTGISILKLDEEVDHGPLLFQKEEAILTDDTSETLYQRLFKIGADYLYQTIQQYIKGDLKLVSQDDKKTTFTKLMNKNDGLIEIDNPPPLEKIKLMIRAFFPWPGVWTKWKMENGKWKILKFLPGGKIQVEGKNPMSYKDFINGYKEGKEILGKLGLTI